MDPSKLTTYREAATAAKARMQAPVTLDVAFDSLDCIPTLATAVVELCAEVERLQARVQELGGSVDYLKL